MRVTEGAGLFEEETVVCMMVLVVAGGFPVIYDGALMVVWVGLL